MWLLLNVIHQFKFPLKPGHGLSVFVKIIITIYNDTDRIKQGHK